MRNLDVLNVPICSLADLKSMGQRSTSTVQHTHLQSVRCMNTLDRKSQIVTFGLNYVAFQLISATNPYSSFITAILQRKSIENQVYPHRF